MNRPNPTLGRFNPTPLPLPRILSSAIYVLPSGYRYEDELEGQMETGQGLGGQMD